MMWTTWIDRAACNGVDADFFHTSKYEVGATHERIPAVEYCLKCPVWLECLDAADEYGLRGRLSPYQRKKLEGHRSQTIEDFIQDVVPDIEYLAVKLALSDAEISIDEEDRYGN